MPFKYKSLGDRIKANVAQFSRFTYGGTLCWIWQGATTTNASGTKYGKLSTRVKRGSRKGKQKTWLVHRLALVVFRGIRMTRRSVGRHLCNNTLCCNPRHLVGGTQRSNVRQCVREGRHYTPFRQGAAA